MNFISNNYFIILSNSSFLIIEINQTILIQVQLSSINTYHYSNKSSNFWSKFTPFSSSIKLISLLIASHAVSNSKSSSSIPSHPRIMHKVISKFQEFSEAIPSSHKSPFLIKRNLSQIRKRKAAFVSFNKLTTVSSRYLVN